MQQLKFFSVRRFLLVLALAALAAGGAVAQDGEERSRFVRFLEGMLSTPERQVSLIGLSGTFSSSPRAERIVVADADGPWLEIDGVEVVWNRTALFRRVLDIDSLRAEQVRMLRKPAGGEQSESADFTGPPVDITIDSFVFPAITLAAPVAGAEARLSAEGSAEVTEEAIGARVALTRTDRPGRLSAELRLQPATNELTADLQLAEPEGGIVAELLNLRGRPPVTVTIAGIGPLSAWQADVQVQAAETRVLAGQAAVSRVDGGYRISGDVVGALGNLVPENYAALLGGDSRLAFNVVRRDDGGLGIDSASLRSAGVELDASGALTPDMVPERADLTLRLGQAGRTALPFVPGEVSVGSLDATIGLDPGAQAPWTAEITAAGVQSTFGFIADTQITASGQASNLVDPAARASTFRMEGSATGVAPTDPKLAEAIGPSVRLTSNGAWSAGAPVTFETLEAILTGATASFSGTANAEELAGRFGVSVTSLTRFAPLAGREIAGSAQLQAEGRVSTAGAFDLQLNGEATDLRAGVAQLDTLLAGPTRIQGGIARDEAGFRFNELALSNPGVNVRVSGSLADPELDLTLAATLADLSSVTERASGAAELSARVTGTTAAPRIEAEVSGAELVLMGRPLTEARARFAGVVAGPETAGEAELGGNLDGVPVQGSARLSAGENGARVLEELLLTVGESRASGNLTLAANNLVSGQLEVVSPDLSKVAPLFLVEASGMLRAEVALSAEGGSQSADISGTATDIVYNDVRLDSAQLSAAARDLFTAPKIDGTFDIRNLRAGGLTVVSAEGTATRQGQSTGFAVDAELADGSATVRGSLEPRGAGVAIALQTVSFSRAGLETSLAAPTTIVVENGTVVLDGARLNAGGGSVTLSGRAGSTLDIAATLDSVPASLVNTVRPDLGAQGAISGDITVTGSAAAPAARFDASWQGASLAATRNAGVGALAVSAEGTLADNVVTLTSRMSGPGGLSLSANGRVGTTADGPLDVTVQLNSVPASLANAFAADLGAEGSISGSARVTGTIASPQGSFDADWGGASVAATRNAGLGTLAVAAEGSIANRAVTLTTQVSAADGLSVRAAGTVGIGAGTPLNIRITGAVPLSLGNRPLAGRGAALQGTLDVDVAVTGAAADPQFAGRITSEGGGFVDPRTGIVLRNISLAAAVSRERITIERLTAASGEGSMSATGSIGLDPAAGFPLDLALRANQARYVDGTLLTARFDADLTVTGSLTRGPVLGGSVFVDRAEVTVPEGLPRGAVALDVEHVAPPGDVRETVAKAKATGRRSTDADGGEPSGVQLNLAINAPQQVFVRGRGLDAELGGQIRLSGPVSAIIADGAFELRRGRFDILTQRITFERGVVTFAGDFDPILDFSGTTDGGDIVVTVAVTGPASDPEVTFSSDPELPQDEVLAHLIFERGLGELSPFQIARLAAVATQVGGGEGGLLNQLRRSTGLDDLDIVVDEEGGPALAAGRYISENVYVGVQQGATAESSRVTIDLEITDDLKARAAASPGGGSSLGIYYEREY